MERGAGSFLNGTSAVVGDFVRERQRQNEKHPETDGYPDGTGAPIFKHLAAIHRLACDLAAERGENTWMHVLREEVHEVFAESEPVKLREELVQVMAVAGRWIQAIDAREKIRETFGG
jgi:hypothetical protein